MTDAIVNARDIDNDIRVLVAEIRYAWDQLQELLEKAMAGEIHLTLGFKSWTAYVADVFQDNPVQLDLSDRRKAVEYLATQGMSTRAIGAVLGVNGSTVGRDLAINGIGGEDMDREVKGLDGGTYKRKRPHRTDVNLRSKQEKRPTVFRQADDIHTELVNVVITIVELVEDKRYANHKDTLLTALRPSFEKMRRLESFLMGDVSTP